MWASLKPARRAPHGEAASTTPERMIHLHSRACNSQAALDNAVLSAGCMTMLLPRQPWLLAKRPPAGRLRQPASLQASQRPAQSRERRRRANAQQVLVSGALTRRPTAGATRRTARRVATLRRIAGITKQRRLTKQRRRRPFTTASLQHAIRRPARHCKGFRLRSSSSSRRSSSSASAAPPVLSP